MAAEAAWICSICCDGRKDVAYVIPCHHEFCLSCILRWAKRKENCPLCRRVMTTIRASGWADDDYLEFVVCPPASPLPAYFQAGTAPGHSSHSPLASPPPSLMLPEEQGAVEPESSAPPVGGLLPKVWAALFRQHREILDPALPWLRQELSVIFGTQWWPAMAAENLILYALCHFGLDSEALVQQLQPGLEDSTAMLIQGLVTTIVHRCGEQARRQLGLQHACAARGQEDGTATSSRVTLSSRPGPSSSPTGASVEDLEELPSTSEAVLPGGPSQPPAAPIPRGQEEPHEESEQAAAAAAGPSAQGSSPSPSAPG
ncbi:TOPRS ligase, partial [Anseranas semipalmata]|nr:TOPRS ligase [Anseranas semipalmata]